MLDEPEGRRYSSVTAALVRAQAGRRAATHLFSRRRRLLAVCIAVAVDGGGGDGGNDGGERALATFEIAVQRAFTRRRRLQTAGPRLQSHFV